MNLDNKNLNLKTELNTLIINLAYTDILSILHTYYLNRFLTEEKMKLINPNNNNLDNNSFYYYYFKKLINGQMPYFKEYSIHYLALKK